MSSVEKVEQEVDPDEEDRLQRIKDKPLLTQCYNLLDFEAVAKNTMKRGAWGYYSSAADDEIVSLRGRSGRGDKGGGGAHKADDVLC
jgi:L-lactate dehydrogenase (cytochrome)